MLRRPIRHAFILLAACLLAGCGSASGIKPGIPSDTPPAAPTPDMAPNPPKVKT